ncbi:MAG: cysteine desulfurase-like protein [Rubrobacteraceae bacterium]
MERTYDIEAVRREFPALARTHNGKPAVYLDGPGGSQMARPAIAAMLRYMEAGGANLHGAFPTSIETEEILDEARRYAAAFLGAGADEIAFGANMTTLTYGVSRALAKDWDSNSEIVVTELDHRANVDSWLQAAEEKGAKVRWLRLDADTLTLDEKEIENVIGGNTKLVAVGLASNIVGTVSDVARVSAIARKAGAVVAVDAVHAAPHVAIDRDELGADILTCSAYKFFGPHVGVAAVRSELFERLDVHKVKPAPDYPPDKLETGTQNHEGIAGMTGALDFIASMGGGGTLRERLLSGMKSIEEYEDGLAEKLRSALRETPGIKIYSAPDGVRKTPTVAFRSDSLSPREICERMSDEGYFIGDGHFYASTVVERLGLREVGGVVRVGVAPYTSEAEVEGFVETLRRFVG